MKLPSVRWFVNRWQTISDNWPCNEARRRRVAKKDGVIVRKSWRDNASILRNVCICTVESAWKDHCTVLPFVNDPQYKVKFVNMYRPRVLGPHISKDVILWTLSADRTVLQRQINQHARFAICPITLANFGIIKLAARDKFKEWWAWSHVFVISRVRNSSVRFHGWTHNAFFHLIISKIIMSHKY